MILLSGVLVVIAHGTVPQVGFLLRAVGVVASSQVAVGALNDWLDRGEDSLGQPEKPIPSGLTSPSVALWLVGFGLTALVPLALSFGITSLVLALLGAAGGLAYDLWLKPTPASIVGYLVGFLSLITWVWVIGGHLTAWFGLVYPAGTLLLIAGHLAQSFPDIESDVRLGHRGLAVILGVRRTQQMIWLSLTGVTLGASALDVFSKNWLSLLLTGLAAAILILARLSTPRVLESRAARLRLFHLVAPAIAVLGVGCLLLVRAAG